MAGKLNFILIIILVVAGTEQRGGNLNEISIHKIWKFVKFDVIKPNLNKGLSFDGNTQLAFLDLTNVSSARFIDKNNKQQEIPYKIDNGILFVESKDAQPIGFKIWKLTENELGLVITYTKTNKEPLDNAIVLLFKAN